MATTDDKDKPRRAESLAGKGSFADTLIKQRKNFESGDYVDKIIDSGDSGAIKSDEKESEYKRPKLDKS